MRSLHMTSRTVLTVLVGLLAALPLAALAAPNLKLTLDVPLNGADDPAHVHYGETVSYTATIVNAGGSTAAGAVLNVTVPAPLELAGVSNCTKADPAQTTLVPCKVGDGAAIPDEPDPASPQFAQVVTIDVTLPVPEGGLPTTCPDGSGLSAITVAVTADPADSDPSDNTVTPAALLIGGWADLGVTLTGAPATSNIGDTFDVVGTVSNAGPCDATKVSADDANPNFAQFITSLGIEFLGSDGDCVNADGDGNIDPTLDSCVWPVVPANGTKTWTLHYKVLPLAQSLMQVSEIVGLSVYSEADEPFDYNPDNDTARSDTLVKKDRASCSTGGGMGQALGLLVLAVPFLRRRRKS